MEPVTIAAKLLFSYVTVDQPSINFWQARLKKSAYAYQARPDYIYVLFRELATRRFGSTPDPAEIRNFVDSPKPLFKSGVIPREDAALVIRFALGEDGLLNHLDYAEIVLIEMRLCVYLYREIGMSEADLKFLLVQVERAVAKDYPDLTAE